MITEKNKNKGDKTMNVNTEIKKQILDAVPAENIIETYEDETMYAMHYGMPSKDATWADGKKHGWIIIKDGKVEDKDFTAGPSGLRTAEDPESLEEYMDFSLS